MDACEIVGIRKGLQDSTPLPRPEIDVTDGPILEGQAQAEVTDHLDRRYVQKLLHRVDARGALPASSPTRFERTFTRHDFGRVLTIRTSGRFS
jgi:hypothetical protein